MGQRANLQSLLETILGEEPEQKTNVYFQSPNNLTMSYPCIRFNLDSDDVKRADNALYAREKRYQLIVIDRNPDSPIPDAVSKLSKCRFSRFYTADNLNHFVFNIYY